MRTRFTAVGRRVVKVDAADKVTGAARFAGDLKLPGMLHARLLRSPYAHARIRRVDVARAAALPGVRAVLTWANAPDQPYTNSKWDATATVNLPLRDQRLFDRKVRYAGEPVAAVAADDPATAARALELIEIEYEPLPVVTDPAAALAATAPLIHEERQSNLIHTMSMAFGDVEAGFAAADFTVQRRFQTAKQKQAQMEPYACVADYSAGGRLTVYTPSQTPHPVRLKLAEWFGWPAARVRVIVPHLGGGFGGRGGLVAELYAAALSVETGRPVQLLFDRSEDFVGTESRHPMTIEVKIGAKNDGTLTALQIHTLVNAGAYATVSSNVTAAHGLFFMRLYKCPNRRFDGQIVYTNTPVSGAFRGFGAPQAWFALEQMVDEVALRAGIDRLELRRRLALQAGDIDPWTRLPIESWGLGECIDRAAAAFGWPEAVARSGRSRGPWRRGCGVALVIWVSGTACLKEDMLEGSAADVRLNVDGSADVTSGATDLGTGIGTTLAQIAAEELGLPLAAVNVVLGDTERTPIDSGAHASRTLFVAGAAVQRAAAAARGQLLQVAAGMLAAEVADLTIEHGQVQVRGAPQRSLPVARVARQAFAQATELTGRGIAPQTNAPGFGCQFAEVEVNTETGEVRVLRIVAAHDVGRAINPTIVEGQIEGSIVQGLGYALSEDLVIDAETGSALNPTLLEYKLPMAADVPPLQVIVVESPDPNGPYGAKGAGEPALVPVAPAIANAVRDATGARLGCLPMTAERVWQALQEVSP